MLTEAVVLPFLTGYGTSVQLTCVKAEDSEGAYQTYPVDMVTHELFAGVVCVRLAAVEPVEVTSGDFQ